ncbi:hypothetical protein LEH10_24370, partial [Salmonella enterica]|nr:hypothetical protein [Salmonella enterica]
KIHPGGTIPDNARASLLPSHIYKIEATKKQRSFTFSEFVWVTKKVMVYPGESFDISTIQNTTMRAKND